MNGLLHLEAEDSEFVEVDPTGRYGRYNEILGKGASKTVYRAFDEYEGIEVAWNQVKLYDFLQSPEDLERLYCEIHLLKTLKHKNIMKFYTSWVDPANRNINFVTEMFTSGTLRQYRQKHKRVNIRAVKHWCRQILLGLLYLHSHDPPVIHRDLKCDNIFVNGNQGEVKIGDLGLAAILRKSHAAHCVGTPEFMAPEVYEEEYNELVDIYSFGMCILEMVTFEYPYSECTHPAQIYKKVISGKKPDALYKVNDPEVRQFVEKCLATVSSRLSARELLKDPFLQIDDLESDVKPIECQREFDNTNPLLRQPFLEYHHSDTSFTNDYSNDCGIEAENGWNYHPPFEIEHSGIELFEYHDDEHSADVDISIKGKRREDGGIVLRIRIADREGRVRNIYFPFDIETDTALSVATEMVAELDITDQDVTKIADMIDGEIVAMVPEWKPGPGIEETPRFANSSFCQNCASKHTSNGSLLNFLSTSPSAKNLHLLQCPCSATHGRFEEITYQVDGSEHNDTDEATAIALSHSHNLQYTEIWDQHEGCEFSSVCSGEDHSDEHSRILDRGKSDEKDVGMENEASSHCRNCFGQLHASHSSSEKDVGMENKASSRCRNCFRQLHVSNSSSEIPSFYAVPDGYENEVQHELRWAKAKYQIKLRELRDFQLGSMPKSSTLCSGSDHTPGKMQNGATNHSISNSLQPYSNEMAQKSISRFDAHLQKSCPDSRTQRARNCEAIKERPKAQNMFTAKSRYTGPLLPHSLHRTTSLPVDAVDI